LFWARVFRRIGRCVKNGLDPAGTFLLKGISLFFGRFRCTLVSLCLAASPFGTAFILGRLPRVEVCWRNAEHRTKPPGTMGRPVRTPMVFSSVIAAGKGCRENLTAFFDFHSGNNHSKRSGV
jgi:hypothetical protein